MFSTIERSDWAQSLTSSLRRNALVIGLIALHWLATVAITRAAGISYSNDAVNILMMLFGSVIPLFLFVLLVWRAVYMLRVVRPKRPSAWLIADVRSVLVDKDRMIGGAITLVMLTVFFTNFSTMKAAIPALHAYAWDPVFARLDAALIGGFDPWTLLWPVLGDPSVLAVLNGAYVAWLFLVYFMVFVACFTRTNPAARTTFLVAFVLTWAIGGNLLATVFSSAGPAYYAVLGLGDRFSGLMANLHAADAVIPVASLKVQDMLWQGYVAGHSFSGISAMPSMHVASSALMMLYAFSYARLAGRLMAVFLTLIMLGSVMTGWHYAVDGYAGIAIALLCWKLAARLAAKPLPRQTGIA